MSFRYTVNNIRALCSRNSLIRLPVRYKLSKRTMEKYLDPEIYGDSSSKVTILSMENSENIIISKFNSLGFTLNNNMAIAGPCIFFPRSYISWKISSVKDINERSLSLFNLLVPKLDMLILGIGNKEEKRHLDSGVIKYLRQKRINFEILPTDQAIATFNFQANDAKWIAAALIPPTVVGSEVLEFVHESIGRKVDVADLTIDQEHYPEVEAGQESLRIGVKTKDHLSPLKEGSTTGHVLPPMAGEATQKHVYVRSPLEIDSDLAHGYGEEMGDVKIVVGARHKVVDERMQKGDTETGTSKSDNTKPDFKDKT